MSVTHVKSPNLKRTQSHRVFFLKIMFLIRDVSAADLSELNLCDVQQIPSFHFCNLNVVESLCQKPFWLQSPFNNRNKNTTWNSLIYF